MKTPTFNEYFDLYQRADREAIVQQNGDYFALCMDLLYNPVPPGHSKKSNEKYTEYSQRLRAIIERPCSMPSSYDEWLDTLDLDEESSE